MNSQALREIMLSLSWSPTSTSFTSLLCHWFQQKEDGLCCLTFMDIESKYYIAMLTLFFQKAQSHHSPGGNNLPVASAISIKCFWLLPLACTFPLTPGRVTLLLTKCRAPHREHDVCCSALRQQLTLPSPDLPSPDEHCILLARCRALLVGCRSCGSEVCHCKIHP